MTDDLFPSPMHSFFPSLSEGMHNLGDFLTLSLPGYGNLPERARESPPLVNPPLTMQIQMQNPLTFTNLLLEPDTDTASSHNTNVNVNANVNTPSRSPRGGRASLAEGQSETIPPPFPWATDRRATVHSHRYLLENKIETITGSVQCKRCDERFEMKLDLDNKLGELLNFIERNKGSMHDRAPKVWSDPVLPTCEHCGRENSVAPLLADTKKKAINWLFLLLSQMLGCCTIKQLKYFCKHTNSHRTGAKDRLVYSTYMTLCKQLLP